MIGSEKVIGERPLTLGDRKFKIVVSLGKFDDGGITYRVVENATPIQLVTMTGMLTDVSAICAIGLGEQVPLSSVFAEAQARLEATVYG